MKELRRIFFSIHIQSLTFMWLKLVWISQERLKHSKNHLSCLSKPLSRKHTGTIVSRLCWQQPVKESFK